MKISILLTALLLMQASANAQTTSIPDNNFEQALIDQGFDDILDDEVLTESIDTITILSVAGLEIADLTGIEDFVSLKELNCLNNELSSLDLSYNTNIEVVNCAINELTAFNLSNCSDLQILVCGNNLLTEVDLSENTSLTLLNISENELSSLDLSDNTMLTELYCNENNLTAIDVSYLYSLNIISCQNNNLLDLDLSTNISLTLCFCQFNELVNLNLKNGNNLSMCSECFSCLNNPDLDCVQVDDPDYSTANWPNRNDHTSFNFECNLSLDSTPSSAFIVYPNPAKDILYIDATEDPITFRIYNSTGELLKQGMLVNGTNLIPVETLVPGFYSVHLAGDNYNKIVKAIIQ